MSKHLHPPPTSTQAKWRDHLKVHPAAELFPRMSEAELIVLGNDIKAHGLANPIVLWSPGIPRDDPLDLYVLDGINRLDAAELVGQPVVNAMGNLVGVFGHFKVLFEKREVFRGSRSKTIEPWIDPYEYAASANIHRRHLSIEVKDRLIVQLLKTNPTKSNRQIAKLTNTSHPHVAKVREQAEKAGDVEIVTTSIDTRGRKQARRKPKPVPTPHVGSSRNVDTARPPGPTTTRTIAVPIEHSIKTVVSSGRVVPEKPSRREDIGPTRGGEVERLQARIDQLEDINHRLEIRVVVLENENAKLRAQLPQDDDDIPPFLQRR